MKMLMKRAFALLLSLVMMVSLLSGLSLLPVSAATVNYVYSGNYIYNWGVRDTVATFLSPMAEAFYEKNAVTYAQLAALSGSSSLDSVPSSALYDALYELMYTNLTNPTDYGETRYQYMYTDCQNNAEDTDAISSFYSGVSIGPEWDTGETWNREHTWPNSKSDSKSGNNGETTLRETDIMMLRPTAASENTDRSNTAYGESSQYYDPNQLGQNVRGDVARVVLYVYTCWGGSEYHDGALDYMWGTAGVIESKDVLLKWMEEDPVDTWEMGRNDSVEAITGTRNVYVDYPELSFLLFNEEVPEDLTSPSGGASSGGSSGGTDTEEPETPDTPDTPVGSGTATITFDDTDKRTTLTTSQQVWEENGVTVTNNKSGSSSNVADYANPARFYKNSELIVAYPGMTKIEFTCDSASYATTLASAISGATVSGNVVTVELDGVDSFTCTLSSGQVRMDSITITYGVEECEHDYAAATCTVPATCTLCGATSGAALGHTYDNTCDTDCDVCGDVRSIEHTYDNDCDTDCNVCGIVRTVGDHVYTNDCDADCNSCGATREVGDHVYTSACDADCNICGAIRTSGDHVYYNDCDTDCNACGATRTPGDHAYTADCDTVCDICGAVREVMGGSGEATITFDANKTQRTAYSTTQQVWVNGDLTVTNTKTSSSSNVGDYSNPVRFYKNSTVTIAYPGMTGIIIDCSGFASSNAGIKDEHITAWTDTLDDLGVIYTVAEKVITITFSGDEFVIDAMSAQARAGSITAIGGSTAIEHVYDDEYDPDCNVCGTLRDIAGNRVYNDLVERSVMETGDGVVGLAFKFELLASGATKDAQYVGDISNATVTYRGQTCKVVKIGALMCNDAAIGESDTTMVRENVEQFAMVDINARLLYQCEETSCFFAVRVTNIPERHQDTVIYARPYCVIEYNGQQITVYDYIVSASYTEVYESN